MGEPNKWYQSPIVWAGIILCLFTLAGQMGEQENTKAVEGVYVKPPLTRRQIRDSLQQGANDSQGTRHRRRATTTKKFYEVEMYIDGKWVKVQQMKIKGFPEPEEIDEDMIFDDYEGK